jgi:hypothetical protein
MSKPRKSRTKFSIISILADHYGTFKNYESNTINPVDYIVYVGLPLASAILLVIFKIRAQNAPDVLAAVAILTGLIFNAVLLISDLSARASETKGARERDAITKQLAEELRANISYAVLLGLTLSALLGAISMFTDTSKSLNVWLTGAVVLLGLQLLLTILMILKRIRSLFRGFYLDNEESERMP